MPNGRSGGFILEKEALKELLRTISETNRGRTTSHRSLAAHGRHPGRGNSARRGVPA
jgi:hypothetical protein